MLAVVENNVFINSLIGTTIQDSSKKERSNEDIKLCGLNNKY